MNRLLFNIVSVSYLILILLGIIKFTLYAQVTDLYEAGSLDQLSALKEHPHFYRFLLVVPVYKIANILTLSPNFVFSVTCGLMILAFDVGDCSADLAGGPRVYIVLSAKDWPEITAFQNKKNSNNDRGQGQVCRGSR